VNGLLAEMIAKFEEEPPLSTKSSAHVDTPNDLLAFVANLKVNEGMSGMDQKNAMAQVEYLFYEFKIEIIMWYCSYRWKSS